MKFYTMSASLFAAIAAVGMASPALASSAATTQTAMHWTATAGDRYAQAQRPEFDSNAPLQAQRPEFDSNAPLRPQTNSTVPVPGTSGNAAAQRPEFDSNAPLQPQRPEFDSNAPLKK